MPSRPFFVLIAATLLAATPVVLDAQTRGQPGPAGRLKVSGWVGGFTSMGGFSDGDDFFRFDVGSGLFSGGSGFGGAVHYALNGGIEFGIEGLLSNPDYTRFDRDEGTQLGTGSASVRSLMLSARLTGAPGQIAFVASGGAGFFSWDVDELGGRNTDFALDIGIGLEYLALPRLIVFGEYTWWWVYHEKDDTVVSNTARNNLLRGGARFIVF